MNTSMNFSRLDAHPSSCLPCPFEIRYLSYHFFFLGALVRETAGKQGDS